MKKLLAPFKKTFQEHLLAFLWRQWSTLGAAGHEEGRDSGVIDPEALLLFSATICRSDPRLFDEIIDWLVTNGRFMNMQRLKTLLNEEDLITKRIVVAIGKVLRIESKDPKWEKLSQLFSDEDIDDRKTKVKLESLFLQKSGEPMAIFGKPHDVFAACGFHRGKLEIRGHSRPFSPIIPANLLLKLRALLGINARCEIIAYLLTHQEAHPGQIARETAYYSKTIQDALVEMTYSGLVQIRPLGREKHYFLETEIWNSHLGIGSRALHWRRWVPLFRALKAIHLKLLHPAIHSLNRLLLSSELRQLMLGIRGDLQAAGFGQCLSDPGHFPGEEYLDVFFSDVMRVLGQLQ